MPGHAPLFHHAPQLVAVDECFRLRLDLADLHALAQFDIAGERVAAPPRRVHRPAGIFERTKHVEFPEVLVGIGIAEDTRNGQRIGAFQQQQFPDGIFLPEDGAGGRFRNHHLVLLRKRPVRIALEHIEAQHVEKHRIGQNILHRKRIVPAYHIVGCRSPKARRGLDLRNLFGQRRGDRRLERRGIPRHLRCIVMYPQLVDAVTVAETTVGGEVVIGIRKDQQADGQPQRKRHHAGKGAAAQFTQVT